MKGHFKMRHNKHYALKSLMNDYLKVQNFCSMKDTKNEKASHRIGKI